MEYEKKEQVIFVKDLLFAAIYQWRKVLVFAIIFAVLLGGASFLIQKNDVAESNSPAVQGAYAQYLQQKELLEESLAQAETLLAKQDDYLKNSTIMQIDPYSVYQASIELTVQTGPQALVSPEYQAPDYTGAILRSYEVCLQDDLLMKEISEKLVLPVKYVRETLTIENGGNETRSLNIRLSYPTEEGAQIILDTLTAYLNQIQPQVAQDVYAHNAKTVASRVSETVCMDFTTSQYNANVRRDNLKSNVTALTSELSALRAPSMTQTISKKKVVLFAVIGAILGAGLVACAAWLSHIVGGKIYSSRTLTNKTGIRILGSVPATAGCSVDKWLRKLEGRSLGENQAAFVAANIRYYCQDAKSILVILDCAKDLCQPILDALTQAGVTINVHRSPIHDAEALNAIPGADAVVAIGLCGVSRYSDAEKIATLLADKNKLLAGYVLLDG